MTSRSFFNSLPTSPRRHTHATQHDITSPNGSGEIALRDLDPRPDSVQTSELLFDQEQPPTHLTFPSIASRRHSSSAQLNDRTVSPRARSKMALRPMFAGPPPPITASMLVEDTSHRPVPRSRDATPDSHQRSQRNTYASSLLLRERHDSRPLRNSDSIWRVLRRRERSLESEVQKLLDLQAAGLVAGSGVLRGAGDGDASVFSDTGSSTPTDTFYSTATSKSRMQNSLHVPTRSTPDGNVIPVRQPRSGKTGLRSARNGIRRSMAAFTDLKQDEEDHVDEALSQRKKALRELKQLNRRRDDISNELSSFEGDAEEPLGQELRHLGTAYEKLNDEISLLEEKLVGMRNQRRWLGEKMDDVKNRREAGLSGYRGALRDAESALTTLLHRPPVQPLDQDVLGEGDDVDHEKLASGDDYLRLNPDRRTVEMARAWWEDEVAILEHRRSLIQQDKEALEEGSTIWADVINLVTEFETSLRQLMKSALTGTTLADEESSSTSSKGKQKAPTQEELLQKQLSGMGQIVEELEQKMQLAEEKRWNLLICAIGAELEAFKEAQDMLADAFDMPAAEVSRQSNAEPTGDEDVGVAEAAEADGHHDSSDNEVPQDLLVSEMRRGSSVSADERPSLAQHSESENEVPTDFLAEHEHEKRD